jgi:peptide chain release factor 1
MRSLLEARLARLVQLEEALGDPALVHDHKRFREVNVEYKHLRALAEVARPYLHGLDELEQSRQLVDGDDEEMAELAREDVERLENELPVLEEKLQDLLLPRDPDDSRDVIVEIRAGTGGDEAALFAADVGRMYTRYAERHGWKMELMEMSESASGGFKEAIFSLRGDGAYGALRYESGVHRVQRVPATESQGRIHTSTCTVAVLPEADEVEIDIKEAELRIDVFRASGPGGQSVNTTDSAVRITHLPTGLVVSIQDEKSQHKNKAKALKVLRARLYEQAKQEQLDKEAASRKAQVGSGDRSEKIRTYNFPQSRVTDHRIGYTAHNLSELLEGDLDDLLEALANAAREAALQAGGAHS